MTKNLLMLLAMLLLCGLVLGSGVPAGHAQGANWAGYPAVPYNAALPAHPVTASSDANGNYSAAQITIQTNAGAALKTDIQNAINAGQTPYTVPFNFPGYANNGVYRFTASGPVVQVGGANNNPVGVSNFTLSAPGITFVMANSGAYLLEGYHNWNADHITGTCSDITIEGSDSAPLIVDRDLLSKTQGTIKSYDPKTGIMQITIMPGYSTQILAADYVTAYRKADGSDIPYSYYHGAYGAYTGGQTIDSTTVQVTADTNDSTRYVTGNFVTLPTGYGDFGSLLLSDEYR